MILNTRAENGSSSAARRARSDPPSRIVGIHPRWAGRRAATAGSRHRIEERLHALVRKALPQSTGVNRIDSVPDRRPRLISSSVEGLAGEVLLRARVVRLAGRLDQLSRAASASAFTVLSGTRDPRSREAPRVGVVPDTRAAHLDQVDDAPKPSSLPMRESAPAPVAPATAIGHHAHHPIEIGPDAVHLVDEGEPRNAVLVGLAPHRLGLRLDAADGAEHRDRPVQHPQRALDLGREVHVAGRVDDVDAVVAARNRSWPRK